MLAQEEPFFGITVVWGTGDLMLLFDAGGDAWLAWKGLLVHRVEVGLA